MPPGFGEVPRIIETVMKSISPTKFLGLTASEDFLNMSPINCNVITQFKCVVLTLSDLQGVFHVLIHVQLTLG